MNFWPVNIYFTVVIQRRGQYESTPADYFSNKLWEDYENGFGNIEEGTPLSPDLILHVHMSGCPDTHTHTYIYI